MEQKRLLSLDAFRGFTIAAMILVNFPGSWSYVYPPLLHAEWNGLTPTDLIFPFFLFIIGVSITLAYSKLMAKGISKKELIRKIVFRSIKIFLVGLLLNYIHHFNLSELRYAGVLQRIALVFFASSLLFIFTPWRVQLMAGAGILILYWLLMVLFPTPGYGTAMLEPGANLAAWVDSNFLPGKLYHRTWDPEGILSTFPAISTCIMGILTGKIIMGRESDERKVNWIFVLGLSATILGYVWSWVFPVNKNLWSSSYVLISGGFAMLLLAASIFRVDLLKNTRIARVGIIFGSNAITIYVLADVLGFLFYGISIGGSSLNEKFVSLADISIFSYKFMSMCYAVMYLGVLFIPAYWLFRRRVFIKL